MKLKFYPKDTVALILRNITDFVQKIMMHIFIWV